MRNLGYEYLKHIFFEKLKVWDMFITKHLVTLVTKTKSETYLYIYIYRKKVLKIKKLKKKQY